MVFDMDPLFYKTSALFEGEGVEGLLINSLLIDKDLTLLLTDTENNLNNQQKKIIVKIQKKYQIF